MIESRALQVAMGSLKARQQLSRTHLTPSMLQVLAYWLKILGSKVYGISLKPEKDSILFKSLQLNKKIDQYFSDITNFDKLNCLVKKIKPDIIFHLAAQSIVSKSFIKPGETFRTNILGSANILETFRLNKIPYLVYITSDKCYLNLDSKKSYKENDTLGGLDNYSSSKASAELIFSSYFNSYFKNNKNLTVASARAGNVIGGGDMKENRIVPDIIKSIIQNKTLNLRNPRATRPWQHVLEPLSGYLQVGAELIKRNKICKNQSFNFGPDSTVNKNVVEVLTEMSVNSNDYNSRRNFLKFFRKNMLSIRQELYEEFKTHIDDPSFDLYFRAAISTYETGGYV